MLSITACQDVNKAEKPENLIPEDKMVEVLTELSLVYAARNFSKQKLEKIGVYPDEFIYKKFNIDSVQFRKSTEYYADHQSQYEAIYDRVKERLQVTKTRLDSLRDIEIKIEDSLKLLKKDSLKELQKEAPDSIRDVNNRIRGVSDSLVLPPPARMDEN